MSRRTFRSLLPTTALLLTAATLGAQAPASTVAAPAPSPAPEVGQMAPDFTLPWADASGTRATPVTLSDLRGKVVVVAFYPKDRTSGCTAEMTRFRDDYATMFGEGVVVLPISADDLESHSSWVKDMSFPFALVSDTALSVADQYGSHTPGRATTNRTVFVIGKDGRVLWRELKFNALSEKAYTELAAEVQKAR
ncbi:MAG TPA: peroxiredoxin [Gemmatimonadaceae bacterium]|nr:peroxiredoxin [Gemmatimonadaceae bacterium]